MFSAVNITEFSSGLGLNDIADFTDSSRALHGVAEAFKEQGVHGFSADPRWWPSRFDINRMLAHSEDRASRLNALQTARSNGSWSEAAKHHLWLANTAQREADVDVALHHLEECVKLRQKLNGDDEDLPDLEKRVVLLKSFQQCAELANTMDSHGLAKDYDSALSLYDEFARLIDSVDWGSETISAQLKEQAEVQKDHHEFLASTQKCLLGNSSDPSSTVDADEKERQHRNYRVIYAQVGRQIGFAPRNACTSEYNKRLQRLLTSLLSEDTNEMLQASDSLLEMKETPLFSALQKLPHWSKQFKALEDMHVHLRRANAAAEERWEEAVELAEEAIAALDDDAPESVTLELREEWKEHCQKRKEKIKDLDRLRLEANRDQDWARAISLTEDRLTRSESRVADPAMRIWTLREMERTRINMHQASFNEARNSNDFGSMLEHAKALKLIAESQRLPENTTPDDEKLDTDETIKVEKSVERAVEFLRVVQPVGAEASTFAQAQCSLL